MNPVIARRRQTRNLKLGLDFPPVDIIPRGFAGRGPGSDLKYHILFKD
jgi:hypothetical protein